MKKTIKKSMEQNKRKKNNYTPTYFHRFLHTFNGLKVLWKEVNFKIELLILFILLVLIAYTINVTEHIKGPIFFAWDKNDTLIFMLLASLTLIPWTFLIATEALNTSIEYLSDFVSPKYHENIRQIKDVSALGVLFSFIGVVLVGIFLIIMMMLVF